MNIGIFTDTYYPEINGVANSAYQLKNALELIGHHVYVFTVSNPDVIYYEPGVMRFPSVPCAFIKERRVSFSLPKLLVKKVQILNLDIIHTQTEFGLGYLGRKIANHLELPVVHTYHTIYEDYTHYLKVPGNSKLKVVAREFSRRCCEHADYIIVPSEKMKQLLESYGVEKRIFAQPTGVDFEKFNSHTEDKMEKIKKMYHLEREQHILVSIGRLSKEKNLSEIINYISKIVKMDEKIKLLVVGDGPERENLKKEVERFELIEQVIFTGAISWRNIENYFAIADAFVCASQSETQGLTYIEALAAGTPILVHNDPCLDGVLQQGVNGYGYDTYEEFFEGYQKIVMSGAYRDIKMRANISNSIKNLSVGQFAKKIVAIYEMALAKKSDI